MNIDISNAHCGPRIQFRDHAWLRVVLVPSTLLAPPRRTSDRWTFARLRQRRGERECLSPRHPRASSEMSRGRMEKPRGFFAGYAAAPPGARTRLERREGEGSACRSASPLRRPSFSRAAPTCAARGAARAREPTACPSPRRKRCFAAVFPRAIFSEDRRASSCTRVAARVTNPAPPLSLSDDLRAGEITR